MAGNVRRDVPISGDPGDSLVVAIKQVRETAERAHDAALRGLPPGFRFEVERNADGTAAVHINDVARGERFKIGEW